MSMLTQAVLNDAVQHGPALAIQWLTGKSRELQKHSDSIPKELCSGKTTVGLPNFVG